MVIRHAHGSTACAYGNSSSPGISCHLQGQWSRCQRSAKRACTGPQTSASLPCPLGLQEKRFEGAQRYLRLSQATRDIAARVKPMSKGLREAVMLLTDNAQLFWAASVRIKRPSWLATRGDRRLGDSLKPHARRTQMHDASRSSRRIYAGGCCIVAACNPARLGQSPQHPSGYALFSIGPQGCFQANRCLVAADSHCHCLLDTFQDLTRRSDTILLTSKASTWTSLSACGQPGQLQLSRACITCRGQHP